MHITIVASDRLSRLISSQYVFARQRGRNDQFFNITTAGVVSVLVSRGLLRLLRYGGGRPDGREFVWAYCWPQA